MVMRTTSIRLPDDVIADLDALADATSRKRNYLITEAVKEFVRREAWHIKRIQHSAAQAQAGNFVPDDEMETFWEAWTGRDGDDGMDEARARIAQEISERPMP